MICGTASVVAWPAGVSIGPSCRPMMPPGLSWETIESTVCSVVVVGS